MAPKAGTAVRDTGPPGTLPLLPIAHCTATNSYTVYFWISHTAAALPGQRETQPQTVQATGKTLKKEEEGLIRKGKSFVWWTQSRCLRDKGGARNRQWWGGTNTMPIVGEITTSLTTFHRSLTRESTLRMSACSTPPLIPSVDQGRCPHCFPPSTSGLRLGRAFGPWWRTLRKPRKHETVRIWGINPKGNQLRSDC